MPGEKLLKNTALLTVSALLMRGAGMLWQVWLARRIGAAGVGLYQLVMSVGFLFATVAVSGVRFTVTRLLAEELGRGRPGSVGAVVGRGEVYALAFGCAAMAGLYLGAGSIARGWIGDERAAPALRLLAFSLPAEGVSGLLSGYFTAVGRVWKSAAEQLGCQLLRMALTAAVLPTGAAEPAAACAAVTGAGAGADILGTLVLLGLYCLDRRQFAVSGAPGQRLTRRMLRLAFPLALSAYARSALSTFRQILVPKGLRASGLSAEAALAGYGVINGMALPLVCPTCLPGALSELLVPELTKAQAAGDTAWLRETVERLERYTLFLSAGLAAAFYAAADVLGALVYHSRESAVFIRILAPMVPLIYTDIITDGCLKGLGEMLRSMTYNVAEALLGLGLVWALLPRWALGGYIAVLYVCEVFNFTLSLRRLHKITGCRIFPAPRGEKAVFSSMCSR